MSVTHNFSNLPMTPIARPAVDEYAEFYAGYISEVEGNNPLGLLERQIEETRALFAPLDEAAAAYRYAPGKWSVRQILGHLTDTERIMTYRMVCIARGETTPLPGFDENRYVAGANFEQRPLGDILQEFLAVRAATLWLVRGLSPEAFNMRGVASSKPITVRALAYIIPGHQLHHMGVLRDRYKAVVR